MARQFECFMGYEGRHGEKKIYKKYRSITIDTPITVTFTKHDIGTWTAAEESYRLYAHAPTKEEALMQLLCTQFGDEV